MYLLRGVLSAFSSTYTHTDTTHEHRESSKVRSQTTMGKKMKWCNAKCLEWSRPNIYMRKIVLNFIFDCSFFSFTCCCRWCWCCVRVFRVPFTALGVWAIENWNEHSTSRTCVYLFVTSIQCSIQLLYINQVAAAAAAACISFSANMEGEKGRILLFKVNISRIRFHWCMEPKKRTKENECKRKWRNVPRQILIFLLMKRRFYRVANAFV